MKTYKGIYYFPDFTAAQNYAKKKGIELLGCETERKTDYKRARVNNFGRGWAIQLYCSGPYVGPEAGTIIPNDPDAPWRYEY